MRACLVFKSFCACNMMQQQSKYKPIKFTCRHRTLLLTDLYQCMAAAAALGRCSIAAKILGYVQDWELQRLLPDMACVRNNAGMTEARHVWQDHGSSRCAAAGSETVCSSEQPVDTLMMCRALQKSIRCARACSITKRQMLDVTWHVHMYEWPLAGRPRISQPCGTAKALGSPPRCALAHMGWRQ